MRLSVIAVFVIALCLPAASETSQCSKDDVLRLVQAGYKKAEIDALCQTSSAFFNRSALAEIQPFAVRRLLNSIVPVEFSPTADQNGAKLHLEDVQFCKATGNHKAEVLGFGEINQAGSGSQHQSIPPYVVFEISDCSLPLNQLKERLSSRISSSIPWFVSSVEFEWVPWELRFRVLSTETNPKFGFTTSANSLAPVKLPTNKLPLAVGNKEVNFNMAFYFTNASISIVFVPEADASQITQLDQVPSLSGLVHWSGKSALSDTVNARFLVTHKALNFLADTYFNANQVVTVQTGLPAVGNIQIKGLHDLSLTEDQLLISGLALDSDKKKYSCKADFQGEDVKLQNVSIEPQDLENCPPLSLDQNSINCNARNTIRSTGANVVAQALKSAYQGKALRSFGSPDRVRLNLGNTMTDVSVYVNDVRSTQTALEVGTWLTFTRP